jgi:hypothetical protein
VNLLIEHPSVHHKLFISEKLLQVFEYGSPVMNWFHQAVIELFVTKDEIHHTHLILDYLASALMIHAFDISK